MFSGKHHDTKRQQTHNQPDKTLGVCGNGHLPADNAVNHERHTKQKSNGHFPHQTLVVGPFSFLFLFHRVIVRTRSNRLCVVSSFFDGLDQCFPVGITAHRNCPLCKVHFCARHSRHLLNRSLDFGDTTRTSSALYDEFLSIAFEPLLEIIGRGLRGVQIGSRFAHVFSPYP